MKGTISERCRQATMRFDWSDLPDDTAIPAVPLLHEAADTIDELVEKLKEARGHAADVAAAGMLIGETLPETHSRVSEKGRALLAVIDAALAKARVR